MRIMAAAAALLLLLLVVSLAAATSNTSDSWGRKRSEEEMRQICIEWKAKHGTTNSSLAEEEEERAYALFKHRLSVLDWRWHKNGYSVFSWERGRSEEETRQIFAEWKVRNWDTYSSITHDQEEHRYTTFKANLRNIDRHNAGYAVGVHDNYKVIGPFFDLTTKEYQPICCGFRPSSARFQRVYEEIQKQQLRLAYAPSSM